MTGLLRKLGLGRPVGAKRHRLASLGRGCAVGQRAKSDADKRALQQIKLALRRTTSERKKGLKLLYHGTPRRNLSSILRRGLLSGWGHKVWFSDRPVVIKGSCEIAVQPPKEGLVNKFDDFLRRLNTLKAGGKIRSIPALPMRSSSSLHSDAAGRLSSTKSGQENGHIVEPFVASLVHVELARLGPSLVLRGRASIAEQRTEDPRL